MNPRKIKLKTGTEILLGKDAKNNDELLKKFKGKENVILHTAAPGSGFCVINKLNPSKKDIHTSGAHCARYSQDWRDNKKNVKMHVFDGKSVRKPFIRKTGTWKITKKPRVITIKKDAIKRLEKKKNA